MLVRILLHFKFQPVNTNVKIQQKEHALKLHKIALVCE